MNYELAKQLKDMGFSQEGKGEELLSHDWHDKAYIPTLSELIEACGDGWIRIERKNGDWGAYKVIQREGINSILSRIGNMPEEAVAKLWLEIQK